MTKLNWIAAAMVVALLASAGHAQQPASAPPELSEDWHWKDPAGTSYPFTVAKVKDGIYLLTDHAKQSTVALWNDAKKRFDLIKGPLAGEGFYIPERKKFVVVTVTDSIALYQEGPPK
jgi:hypothetical protein